MELKQYCKVMCLPLLLSACATDGTFDVGKAISVGAGVVQATTLSEEQVKETSYQAAQELDGQNKIADTNSNYGRRLVKIVSGFENYDGLSLNFKVYVSDDVNAFAMADGTVRVYTGLLDAMPDDQVRAVIGHEIGHVALKHSFNQMREQLLTNSAFQAAAAVGGTVGSLTSSQLGQLAYTAVNARFSQNDELEADAFAVKMLRDTGYDPYSMKRSIQTLQAKYGSGGGFLSSHPSNDRRIAQIEEAISQL